MARLSENPKVSWGEASRPTCNASPVLSNLDRLKFSIPKAHHANDRWSHATLAANRIIRTHVLNRGGRAVRSPADTLS
jgi:hypothetical protein